jgi:hypothetical protein
MSKNVLLAFCVLCAVVLIGCNKTETMSSNSSNSNSSTSTTDKKMNMSTPETNTASTSGDKIGVPECDDFIAKYDACVSSKVPEMARAQYKSAVAQWRASWKKLAENPQTKGTLAMACKQAAEQQATALKSYGCSF